MAGDAKQAGGREVLGFAGEGLSLTRARATILDVRRIDPARKPAERPRT